MPFPESRSAVGKSPVPYRKPIVGVIVALIGICLLWLLPVTRQTFISLWGIPKATPLPALRTLEAIPLPVLNAPNAIKPETAADLHLVAHWGNGVFYSMAWSPDGRYFGVGTTFGVNLYEAGTFQHLGN